MASKLPIVYPSRARAVWLEVENDPKFELKGDRDYVLEKWREAPLTFQTKALLLTCIALILNVWLAVYCMHRPAETIWAVVGTFAVFGTLISFGALCAAGFSLDDHFRGNTRIEYLANNWMALPLFRLNLCSIEWQSRLLSRRRPLLGYVLSVVEQVERSKKRVGEQLALTIDACTNAIQKLEAHRLIAEGITLSALVEEYGLIVHSINKTNEQSRVMEDEIKEHQIAVFQTCDLCTTALCDLIPRIRLASELDNLPRGVADAGAVEGVWCELELEVERQVALANECLCKALIPLPQTAQISATPSRPATSSAIRRVK